MPNVVKVFITPHSSLTLLSLEDSPSNVYNIETCLTIVLWEYLDFVENENEVKFVNRLVFRLKNCVPGKKLICWCQRILYSVDVSDLFTECR